MKQEPEQQCYLCPGENKQTAQRKTQEERMEMSGGDREREREREREHSFLAGETYTLHLLCSQEHQ